MAKLNCTPNPTEVMKHLFIILIFILSFQSESRAQVISGVINKYTSVQALDTCSVTLTVKDASLFKVNEKVLLMQMSGATMQSTNSSFFGSILNMKNTGKYEINQIDSISGNILFLKFKFVNLYYPTGGVLQLVSFPSYTSAAVNDTLRAKPWDGETGGIVAFEAINVTLNAPIIASGMGFRGGATKSYNQCEASGLYNDYFYALTSTTDANGGPKGEGIVPFLSGRETGKGPQANGGGGGNNHKSGGGGGGHLGSGGQGGETNRANFLRCPGRNPGLGGISLSSSGVDQVFMGGGGGAGQNKEATDSKGGNGGGIVIIKAKTFEGNNKSITVAAVNAPISEGDGAGGGGAGGSIVLQVDAFTGNLSLDAKGGKGGNSRAIPAYDFGPGGGGAGGRILMSSTSTSITTSTIAGTAGFNISTLDFQNATKGTDGKAAIVKDMTLPFANDTIFRKVSITTQPVAKLICEGDTALLTVAATGPSLTYEWQINKGTGYTPLSNDTTYAGVNSTRLLIRKVSTLLNPNLYRCVIKSNCLNSAITNTNEISLIIKAIPIPIFSYAVNKNTVTFANGSSNGLTYKWTFGNGASDTSRSPIHTYALQDTYRVVLIATNECGTVSFNALINLNTPPFAGFRANGLDACPPSTIFFTNTSSDNVRRYFWSFPGAVPDTSNALNPAVTYSNPGLYDIRLIVENGYGRDTFIRKQYVKINSVPVVDFSATKNGLTASFINNTSNATSFLWTFGDGNTSTQVSPQYTYRNAGTYVVQLKATNACGSVFDTVKLVIFSLPSATIATSQSQGCAPMVVQYSGRNTTNVTSWNWSFPGGIPATSNQANPRVTYAQPGKYDVLLTMTNSAGTSNIKQDTLINVNISPKATFNYKVTADVVEIFNTSKDADNYSWDFGDGTKSEDANPAPHRYGRNGNYTITLLAQNKFCSAATERQAAVFFTSSQDVNTEKYIKTHPNPTTGTLFIEFQNELLNNVEYSKLQLNVLNTDGKLVKNIQLNKESQQVIDMTDLANGVYILQFLNEKHNFVKKVVKM